MKPAEILKVAAAHNDKLGKATVRLEPKKILDEALVGIRFKADGAHLLYSYYRLAEAYQADFKGTYEEALEFVDYNTVRALPYMTAESQVAPLLTYARRYARVVPD